MELSGKVALVTGSSRGIGRAIAIALGQAGADVAVHYVNNRARAEDVAREINAAGRRAIVVGGDVAKRAVVNDIVANTQDQLGAIDILVNNGAVFLEGVPLWDITEEQWDRIFAVNVKGPLLTVQAVIPPMKAKNSGAILNISSLGADAVLHGFAAYVSCKGALNALTRSMALELAPWNIRVNALSPGHIDTEDNLEWITADPEREKRFRARIALGRLGKVEEIARTAVFLTSDDAGYITGQVIQAEGGLLMWQGPIV
jgi:3-oxoacyl-[acyl-carrier protein] reductase